MLSFGIASGSTTFITCLILLLVQFYGATPLPGVRRLRATHQALLLRGNT
jgi:hypothetical protein